MKKLIYKEIFASVKIIKAFMKMKENGQNVYKTEGAVRRCSTKQVFLKFRKFHTKNYCVGVTY